MKKEKENVFRVGDRVWHPLHGWVEIERFVGDGTFYVKKENAQ